MFHREIHRENGKKKEQKETKRKIQERVNAVLTELVSDNETGNLHFKGR